jgi:intracellular sulfur oxidation DsrE/DsrF family protein
LHICVSKHIAMKKTIHQALLIACFATISIAIFGQQEQKPADSKFKFQTQVALPIKDYGQVYNVPFAVDRPDSTMQYKILFEVSMEKIDSATKIYEPLDIAARLYNLHVYGGVPQKNLDVVLVIGGFGIPVVMTNEAYKKKFGVDNPNLKILEEIKAAGIKIICCAQAMMKNHIDPSEVNPIITPIFSRMTSVSTYQLKGYAYFKF